MRVIPATNGVPALRLQVLLGDRPRRKANQLAVFIFLFLLAGTGLDGTILIFSAVSVLGPIPSQRYVPEIKGVSVERNEHHLLSGKPLAERGR